MDKYSVEDLVSLAVSQKPTDFATAFGDIMVDKLQSAVAFKKADIAQTMFNEPKEQEQEQELEPEEGTDETSE